jgi:hypothetical protein
MAAPFRRGQKLHYHGPHHPHGPAKYVKWMGFERSSLIVVEFPDKTRATVHVDDVRSEEN